MLLFVELYCTYIYYILLMSEFRFIVDLYQWLLRVITIILVTCHHDAVELGIRIDTLMIVINNETKKKKKKK